MDDIVIHPNVSGTANAHTEGVGRLYTKEVRKVCVRENDRPLTTRARRPLVHHSVKARIDLVPEYRLAALRGQHFDPLAADGRRHALRGIAGFREFTDDRKRQEKAIR